MSTISTPPTSQRPILESIAMRLDAAMEALVQARDFLVRQLEYQMVQLQEMRQAVSVLVDQPIENEAPFHQAPPVIDVPTVGEAIPAYAASAQTLPLEALFGSSTEVEVEAAPFSTSSLFENAPAPNWSWDHSEAGGVAVAEPEVIKAKVESAESVLIQATASSDSVDPALEKATIDELNDALSRAFAQIASRGGMKRQA